VYNSTHSLTSALDGCERMGRNRPLSLSLETVVNDGDEGEKLSRWKCSL